MNKSFADFPLKPLGYVAIKIDEKQPDSGKKSLK